MSAATIISQAFGEEALEDLYGKVLGINNSDTSTCTDSTPSQSQLRKAYYRRALQYHPDKQQRKSPEEIEDAKRKFQAVSVAYDILSNEDKRRHYDETGELDDGGDADADAGNAWKEYFQKIFGKVTTKDIDAFTESYKCSDEEEKDVMKYYVRYKGNFDKMLECVMCSNDLDKDRWIEDYIRPAIARKEVEDFLDVDDNNCDESGDDSESDNQDLEEDLEENLEEEDVKMSEFSDNGDETETEDEQEDEDDNRRRRNSKNTKRGNKKQSASSKSSNTKVPAAKAKPAMRKNVKKGTSPKSKKKESPAVSEDLIAAIRNKGRGGEGFGSILTGLEERYAPKPKKGRGKNSTSAVKKKKKTKAPQEDIPDDEFERIQKRMESQRKSKNRGK